MRKKEKINNFPINKEKINIVYGLSEYQLEFIFNNEVLTEKYDSWKNPVRMTEYNNKMMNSNGFKDPISVDYTINAYHFLKDRASTWNTYINEDEKSWPLWNAYYQLTQSDSKFNYKRLFEKLVEKYPTANQIDKPLANNFITKFIMKNYFKSKIYSRYLSKNRIHNEVTELLIMRGCKSGLELSKNHDMLEIYFVLDGINMENVVYKKEIEGNSITARELRYLYRNRHQLKGNINFINQGEIVLAPWASNGELWKNYHPKKSLEKIREKNKSTTVISKIKEHGQDICR